MPKLLRYFALTLGGIIALSAIGLFIATRDEAAPDIADLTPRIITVPPEENAYLILQALAADFVALPKHADYDAASRRLQAENGWSITDAELVVHRADPIWPRFDAVSGITGYVDSEPTVVFKRRPYISGLNKLWELAFIRNKLAAEKEGPDRALALALSTQRKALHVSDAGGTLVDTVVGIGMYAIAHQSLQELIMKNNASAAALGHCIDELEKCRMSESGLADSFKTVYHVAPAEIESMRSRHGSESSLWDLDLPRGAQWLYKPNQTARIHAEQIRALIAVIDQPHWKIKNAQPNTASPFLFAKIPTPDNAYGKAFVEMVPSVYASILKSRLRVQTTVSVSQAWIAATLFERIHGNLPDSLEQLVPEYFPTVPRDYFTGEAIRYSPAARTVWSAGENDLVLTSSDQEIPSRAIAMKLKP